MLTTLLEIVGVSTYDNHMGLNGLSHGYLYIHLIISFNYDLVLRTESSFTISDQISYTVYRLLSCDVMLFVTETPIGSLRAQPAIYLYH
jgi:hypothetical protein